MLKEKARRSVIVFMLIGLVGSISPAYAKNEPSIAQYNSIEKSLDGVTNYKSKINNINKGLKEKKVKDITCTITFNKTLDDDSLEEYIKSHKIKPIQIQSRGIENNERITGASIYHNNMKKQLKELMGEAAFLGFTDMYCKIDYDNIEQIENDPLTFLVDTSLDDSVTNSKEFFPHSLTWLLEDLNA